MIPYCRQNRIDEDEIVSRKFRSLKDIRTSFYGDESLPISDSEDQEILKHCEEFVQSKVRAVGSKRRVRFHRSEAKNDLSTRFGISGLLLLYYVVYIIWMIRRFHKS